MSIMLKSGVTFCEIGDTHVFLDLEQDRYFGLPSYVLRGRSDEPAFQSLLTRRLLIGEGDICPAVSAFVCQAATRDLTEPLRSRAYDALRACCAQVRAAARLRRHGFSRAIEHARRAAAPRDTDSEAISSSHLAAVSAFRAVAPLFTQEKACLTRSLALMAVLARTSAPATLVIGVKLHPFAAHAWVQAGTTVLNDTIDVVRGFKPIASV